jgi:hypothetical protein
MPVISGPALGVDFFDREDEVKAILESLRRDNILLVAPRRYGKTSVINFLRNYKFSIFPPITNIPSLT